MFGACTQVLLKSCADTRVLEIEKNWLFLQEGDRTVKPDTSILETACNEERYKAGEFVSTGTAHTDTPHIPRASPLNAL